MSGAWQSVFSSTISEFGFFARHWRLPVVLRYRAELFAPWKDFDHAITPGPMTLPISA
ncbi:hypothetical protein [uncultured Roseobacter sp.]|uniref:hypothetical protein n=1 Tax=uncultured Roseobacter sp. TaxID=114847 RepID=UPI002629F117|nr:hypothetical protein [uncultured Roseobacter sp.]